MKEIKATLKPLIKDMMQGKYKHGRKQAIYIEGSVGIGKSEVLKQLSEELSEELGKPVGFKDLRLTLLDPTDLRGIPFWDEDPETHDRKTVWLTPAFLPDEKRDGEFGMLCLDELTTALVTVQQATYQILIPPYSLGEYQLPKGWVVIAAGNGMTDRAMVHSLPSPLVNRVMYLQAEASFDDWKEYELRRGMSTEIIYYLEKMGRDHFVGKPGPEPFPSPRSWELLDACSKSLGMEALYKDAKGSDRGFQIIASFVGKGPAAEFQSFLEFRNDMPDPDLILGSPPSYTNGKDLLADTKKVDIQWALTGALISRFRDKPTPAMGGRLLDYSLKIPDLYKAETGQGGWKEFGALLIRDCFTLDKDNAGPHRKALCKHPQFAEWSKKYKELLV